MPDPTPVINFSPADLQPTGNTSVFGSAERIDDYSPGSASWKVTSASDVLVYDVPNSKIGDFLLYALGTQYTKADGTLGRTLPMQHPRFSYLWATNIADDRGVKYNSRNAGHVSFDNIPGTMGLPMPYSEYMLRRVHVEFSQPPWSYRTDTDIVGDIKLWSQSSTPSPMTLTTQQEWFRNTDTGNIKAYGDYISIEGQQVAFAEGPIAGTPLPANASIGFPISKAGFALKWMHVPASYLLGTVGYPANVLSGIGRLNAYSFLGFPPGTLLIEPPDFEYSVNPIAYAGPPQYLYNVTINFKFFDPTPGTSTPMPHAGRVHGHNLAPMAADGLWYYVTRVPVSQTPFPTGDDRNPPLYRFYPPGYLFLSPQGQTLNPLYGNGATDGPHD